MHAETFHRHPLGGRFEILVQINAQHATGQRPLALMRCLSRLPSSTANCPSTIDITTSSMRTKGIGWSARAKAIGWIQEFSRP